VSELDSPLPSVAPPSSAATAVRGTLISCRDDPFLTDPEAAFTCEPDGLVICQDGKILAVGAYDKVKDQLPPDCDITNYSGCLVSPGFIDAHVHYAQIPVIGTHADGLLDWLGKYTYPAEQELADENVAAHLAALFCDELLRNGTTSAAVFCTVHAHSVETLFNEAKRRNMRLIAGKVLMDRNAPHAICDTAKGGYDESKALIDRWHGRGRALYAITPRFAGTSTPEQLEMAGALWKEHPGVFVQTHIAESRDEVAWVRQLYPDHDSYLDIYDRYGLIGRRSLLAHGVHLGETELYRCHKAGAALAHCPSSNLFLGSGLFRLRNAKHVQRPVEVGLGSDIGAGTSFSLLAAMGEAYKVAQLNRAAISAIEAFFLATLGGARALALDDRIGMLQPGHEADLVVLDPHATPLLAARNRQTESVRDTLSVLMTLGDPRAVRATYVAGRLQRLTPARRGRMVRPRGQ
jgi:guanine deaminase